MKAWSRVVVAAAMLGAAACQGMRGDASTRPAGTASAPLVCGEEQIGEEALRKAGSARDGVAVLPNGRAVTPAGERTRTGEWPIGLVVNAAGTRAYVTHADDKPHGLMVLDLDKHEPVQSIPLKSAFRGLALSPDGATLYVGGGYTGKVFRFPVAPDGTLEGGTELEVGGYIADVALSPDGATLYAVANTTSVVHVIDTVAWQEKGRLRAGTFPYDLVVGHDGATLWVSNLASSTVIGISTTTSDQVARVGVPKGPEAMALSPDGKRLYVACSDADAVAVIDTVAGTLAATFDVTGDPLFRRHGNVNGIAVSPDGSRVFVSHAGFNKVDVLDAAAGTVLGSIPTGWYPTEVAAGTGALHILSSKGFGSEATLKTIFGFLATLPYPDEATLAALSEKVEGNNGRASRYFTGTCTPDQIPPLAGEDSPIEHVVLIVRENKTYDMLLGDFERGDGDPALVVFPEAVTPNLHKLAREFTNLDNYYSNPENSIQGHMWTTTAHCNDFIEKTRHDQIPIAGYEPAALPDSPTVFDNCFANGVSFRVYGELPSFAKYMFDKYFDEFDNKYPFWNQAIRDVDKASEFIRELELGIFERFTYIVLPNDHTYGGKAGKPTPRSMVADNDRATAMIVEAISRSPYWPKTAIFIIEDDPQGSGDHVEPHRSICIVVSPWARRGYTSSVHYDIPALHRTIEMILGLPAMGKNDAYAPAMLDVWVDGESEKPDYTPFTGVPVDVPLDEVNPEGNTIEALTAGCDFDEVDGCPGLAQALWRSMRGDEEPPPYARGIDR